MAKRKTQAEYEQLWEDLMKYDMFDEENIFNKKQLENQIKSKDTKSKIPNSLIKELTLTDAFKQIKVRNLTTARKKVQDIKDNFWKEKGQQILNDTPTDAVAKLPKRFWKFYKLNREDFVSE